jgi:Fe-S cluster assembly protein SufD
MNAQSPFFISLQEISKSWDALQKTKLEKILALGLPSRHDETWKYTSLSQLEKSSFQAQSSLLPKLGEIQKYFAQGAVNLVFVNGLFAETSSEKLPSSLSFKKDKSSTHETVGDFFNQLMPYFSPEHYQFVVSAKTKIDQPIHLIFLNSSDFSAASIDVHAETLSESVWIESHIGLSGEANFAHSSLALSLDAGASVHHHFLEASTAVGKNISFINASLARDSFFKSFIQSTGSTLSRTHLKVALSGENAEAKLSGLYVLEDNRHHDLLLDIHHAVPRATSSQLYRGLLSGKSHGVFTGKVLVDKMATGTLSGQLNQNLLLSKDCHVDTRPQLEILHNDVKCSHGATIGRLSEKEIFYLQSRGLSRELAETVLSLGFIRSLLETEAHPVASQLAVGFLRSQTKVGSQL